MSPALTREEVSPVTRLMKALGDETRLRIVALLSHGEVCVCHVVEALAISQPGASRHLAVLKSAGVVASRRAGSWIHYRLAPQADATCRHMLDTLVRGFSARATLRRDVERLLRKRGPEACR
jgi:ArsR family transcriptional regulator, arsenate/arsenite/antimonite-responsive transcriptional repressor